jgi:hypothetical protein
MKDTFEEIHKELIKPFAPTEIKFRVGRAMMQRDASGAPYVFCEVFPYVDTRAVMERLDEACGFGGWEEIQPSPINFKEYKKGYGNNPDKEYEKFGFISGLRIKCKEGSVEFFDGSDETDTEAFKGGLSNSFKRVCSKAGIGRYLYKIKGLLAYTSMNQNEYPNKAKLRSDSSDVYYSWMEPQLPIWALPNQNDIATEAEINEIKDYSYFIDKDAHEAIKKDIESGTITREKAWRYISRLRSQININDANLLNKKKSLKSFENQTEQPSAPLKKRMEEPEDFSFEA